MPPRISVVIPTYNRAELLRRTLDSLTDPPDDHTADIVKTFEDRLRRHGLSTRFDRTAWAVEPPHERDTGEMLASAKRTMRQFLDKTHEPGVELAWASLERDDPLIAETEHRTLTAWTDRARDIGVRAEIEHHTADAGGPVCVVGCGDDIPDTRRTSYLT
jgi:hypothetical protein